MLVPVILSGGAGTRLWPVSREGHPKPFMKMPDGQSLLAKAFLRGSALVGDGAIVTVTNREYFFITKDELDAVPLATRPKHVLLLEPEARNTAPAVAMAALWIKEKFGGDAVMLVMAADHLIADQSAFERAVGKTRALAAQGRLVTFGIKPTRPETGFGYIERGAALGDPECFQVKRFVEKPDAERAKQLLATGESYWNSGMFCFTAASVLSALEKHAPDVLSASVACWRASQPRNSEGSQLFDFDPATFGRIPEISVDYAIMERAGNVAMVSCDFGWSDVGSWTAISELVAPDAQNNRVIGNAVVLDSRDSYIQSEERLVATIGVADLLIVDTKDALLVADRSKAQDVRKIVSELKSKGHESYKSHRTVFRPWGTYTVIEEGPSFKIKRIVVKPGASLSLQMHKHRSEHWVVVSGTAKVVNGEAESQVGTNESTYIPAGRKHRLENAGSKDLVLIEVQSGDYLGEDDIVRFEDKYGRK